MGSNETTSRETVNARPKPSAFVLDANWAMELFSGLQETIALDGLCVRTIEASIEGDRFVVRVGDDKGEIWGKMIPIEKR